MPWRQLLGNDLPQKPTALKQLRSAATRIPTATSSLFCGLSRRWRRSFLARGHPFAHGGAGLRLRRAR
eukprot:9782806-Alexandrium_andersonii.AAC.1